MSIQRQIFATVRDVRNDTFGEISVRVEAPDGDSFKFFAQTLIGTIHATPKAVCDSYNDARFELLHITCAPVPDQPVEPSLPEDDDERPVNA